VADLETTLLTGKDDDDNDDDDDDNDENKTEYILIGHSLEGGLVVQSLLANSSPKFKRRTKAAVLLGTFPLGLTPPVKILFQKRNTYNHLGYLGICPAGRLFRRDYLRHIFLLPTTDVNGKWQW